MTEQWQELKETITEMRDNDGTETQQDVCKFLANYMETLEKQMQQPCEDTISRQAVIEHICENKECYKEECKGRILKRCPDLQWVLDLPSVTPTSEDIKEAYLKGYDYGVKDWFKSKQQPCEDCISRQKALDCFEQTNTRQGAKYAIETLPSVTPQRPKGRWMATENEETNIVGYYCSCCDLPMETEERTKYCPNCGAEMSGGD